MSDKKCHKKYLPKTIICKLTDLETEIHSDY